MDNIPEIRIKCNKPMKQMTLEMYGKAIYKMKRYKKLAIKQNKVIKILTTDLDRIRLERDECLDTQLQQQEQLKELQACCEDMAFYKSCAISGEVPKEGDQPSARSKK